MESLKYNKNINKYRRIIRIEHPEENEKYTIFHLFTGPCDPDERLSLTPSEVDAIRNNQTNMELQSNTGEYYMPDIVKGNLIGVYY